MRLGDASAPVLDQRKVIIDYVDANGEESRRTIVPLLIAGSFAGGRLDVLYVEARCLTAKAKRTFRIDRIRELSDAATGEVLDLLEWARGLEVGPLSLVDEAEPVEEITSAARVRSPSRLWLVAAMLLAGYLIGRFRILHLLLVATHMHWGRWL
ncbi:WYL domain-containing protein [Sphingomonas sp. TF3]|uniref:WYL domain-containing protein n=2 Tax=Pseudomonadota TaxID=1224 RepID=UPI000F892889|nr:WYL domain-containing protein [Sphingomonas sp. TF3]RUN77302.1 WYL domain-containing protein [Sphingomonas sp. TF3]